MAQKFKVNQIILSGSALTATGSSLYVNGQIVSTDTSALATIANLQLTGISLKSSMDLVSGEIITTGQNLYEYITSLSGAVKINNILITGSGILGYIPKFTNELTGIINSNLFDLNGNIGINTNNPDFNLNVHGNIGIELTGVNTLFSGSGNSIYYAQLNIQNYNTGQSGSSDLVATADNGNENNLYINLGINSSKYTGSYVGLANDTYLISKSNDLFIGNVVAGKKVHFFAETTPTGANSGVFNISSGAMNVNTPLFISGNSVTPFVSGSGIIFSSFGGVPTINTKMHEQSGIQVSGSLAISANTYLSVASGNYSAGGWLFIGNVAVLVPGMTKFVVNVRLWNNVSAGQTYYMGQAMMMMSSGSPNNQSIVSLPFVQFVNLTGASNLVSLSCTASANSTVMAIPSGNLVVGTPSGTTTYMRGIRLY